MKYQQPRPQRAVNMNHHQHDDHHHRPQPRLCRQPQQARNQRQLCTLGFTLMILSCLAASLQSLAPARAASPTANATTAAAVAAAAAATSAKLVLVGSSNKQQQDTVRVNFTDCGARNIKEVRITPCPGDGSVCNINLGTNVTVEADFIAKHEASSLNEIIKGVIRGRELQFPEQRTDPCKSTISPSCPIRPGKLYQYKATFEVKAHYPAIPVKVRYALANAAGDIVACVQISAKIVDPSPVRSSRAKPKKKTAAAAA